MAVFTSSRIAALIVKAINARGITFEEVAQKVGCTEASIYGWCRGYNHPSTKNGMKLCQILGISEQSYLTAYKRDREEFHVNPHGGSRPSDASAKEVAADPMRQPATTARVEDVLCDVMTIASIAGGMSTRKRQSFQMLAEHWQSLTQHQCDAAVAMIAALSQTEGVSS